MASAVAPGSRGRHPTLRTFRRLAAAALCLAPLAAAAADLAPWSGDPKPPLALDTVDGTRLDLADLQDRPVLVHFFATWCAPCIEEMAGLKRLAAGPQGQALHIVAVDVGEVDIRVRRFRDAEGLTFPVLLDRDRAAARAWGVAGLPTTLHPRRRPRERPPRRGRRRLGRPRDPRRHRPTDRHPSGGKPAATPREDRIR